MDVSGTITMDNVAVCRVEHLMYNCRAAASICVIQIGRGDLAL